MGIYSITYKDKDGNKRYIFEKVDKINEVCNELMKKGCGTFFIKAI